MTGIQCGQSDNIKDMHCSGNNPGGAYMAPLLGKLVVIREGFLEGVSGGA